LIAVDTNVLVRLLIDDPRSQPQVVAAKALLREKGPVFVAQIVQVEVVWVLETAYQFDKQAVLKALDHLVVSSLYILQHDLRFQDAVNKFTRLNADFSDCLILEEAAMQDCELFTFDRRLSRVDGVKMVEFS
jgi:predicted nucleic-acid-binding protein